MEAGKGAAPRDICNKTWKELVGRCDAPKYIAVRRTSPKNVFLIYKYFAALRLIERFKKVFYDP